jgi:xylulokinase
MKADICRVQLRVPQITEAACLGAALLAAVGTGAERDIASCVSHAVRSDKIMEPRQEQAGRYNRLYELHGKLYPALRPLHGQMPSECD